MSPDAQKPHNEPPSPGSPAAAARGVATSRTGTQEGGFYEAYATFSRTLRTWLVAYGIGAPVLVMSQTDLARRLVEAGQARTIALLFLSGVVVQIIAAFLYKISMWYAYVGELDAVPDGESEIEKTYRYRFFTWLSDQLWLEILIDVSSIALFGLATFRLLNAVTAFVDPSII